jgi:hypothetical protein
MDLKQATSFNGKQPDELNINEAIIFNMKLNKYPICNVGCDGKYSKCPYNYLKNKPLCGYNKMSVSSLYSCHDENNLCWGLRLGEHKLFKYNLISLDFDVNSKSGTDILTKKLLNEYMNIGVKDGMYSSSTEGNYNVIIDIYHSEKIKYILNDVNKKKSKININNLEILIEGSFQVIPPTSTICKVLGISAPRKYLNDVHVYKICKVDDPIEDFIIKKIYDKIKLTHQHCFDDLAYYPCFDDFT